MKLERYSGNPVLKPIEGNEWESRAVFNCAAVYLDGRVHIVYRAQDGAGVSRLGYAMSEDGFHITTRLKEPVYTPGGEIEKYGCEDPRISVVGDKLYMSYVAYGEKPNMAAKVPRSIQIGITAIDIDDFLNHEWNWKEPYYPFPGVDNKGAVIFPHRFNGEYILYHRIPPHIWIAYSRDLRHWYNSSIILSPEYEWEYYKIGTGAPPIKTDYGWLLIYHAVDRTRTYRLGYFIASKDDPAEIIYRHPEPILEPEKEFETQGEVSNVVFTCGAVLVGDTVIVYYGGADTVICVATAKLEDFIKPAITQSLV